MNTFPAITRSSRRPSEANTKLKGMWKEYVDAYNNFWDYLERHEELLQREENVNKVCRIMEECPVVNFSCVRDLMYTMRQIAGEKRFDEGEKYWKERLQSKVDRCIENISRKDLEDFHKKEKERKEDLGVEVNNYNFLQRHQLIDRVLEEFTKRADCLLEKQHQLWDLPVPKYKRQVYGQDIYRQQGLILNFNILRTFCVNVKKYFELEPRQCRDLLQKVTDEALEPEAVCTQAVDRYIPHWYKGQLLPSEDRPQTLTRISIWPLHEPVLSSYSSRCEALVRRCEANRTELQDQGKTKSASPPIYIPLYTTENEVIFLHGCEDSTKKLLKTESFPQNITDSPHFQRVMNIVRSEDYCLYPAETDPSEKSKWVYYIVMFDPTVSPEAADQGYIGMAISPLKRWIEHTGPKGEHDQMLVHYNLTLLDQYVQQRGEDLSDYVAMFVLGNTNEEICRDVEGMLIRESFDGDFSVTNMKYGMNHGSAKQPNQTKIEEQCAACSIKRQELQAKHEEEFAEMVKEVSNTEYLRSSGKRRRRNIPKMSGRTKTYGIALRSRTAMKKSSRQKDSLVGYAKITDSFKPDRPH